MTGLSRVLALLEGATWPKLPRVSWVEQLGAHLVEALLRGGVLTSGGLATHLPCPLGGCARRVVALPDSGLVGLCEREDGAGCEELRVTPEQAELLVVSDEGLVRQLRRALRLGGTTQPDAGFPGALLLGEGAGGPVFFARQPGLAGFEAWLGSLAEGTVWVPTRRWAPPAVLQRFRAPPVEVRVLDGALRLEGHQLVVPWEPPQLLVRDVAAPRLVASAPVVCEVLDGQGRRPLTAAAYAELVAEAESFDLFLDTTTATRGGSYPGLRRLEDGTVERVALTKHEAAVIVELVTTGRALRAGDFKTLTVGAVDKVVEHARRKLDVKFGRYEWRAIHTLQGASKEAKQWQFRPEGLGRWGVVVAKSLS